MTDLLEPTTTSREVLILPTADTVRAQLQQVREFQHVVRELFLEGTDFGTIPGTGGRPTLLKPGAEKLVKLLHLADTYDYLEQVEDWERGFFNYAIRCRLRHMDTGNVVAEGLGSCNSMESRYRYRWLWPNEATDEQKRNAVVRFTRNGGKQYRVVNDDPFSLTNTILKMASKRALVAAALSVGRLSNLFTQDLEDIEPMLEPEPAAVASQGPPPPAPPTPERPPAPPITEADDPVWLRWRELVDRGRPLGLPIPTLTLPANREALVAAGKALATAIAAREAPVFDPPEAEPVSG
ncbi:MAG TPA: hypothetical protein VII06_09485 [Chloroflexota bacterium]|jgi:hypothetical protein